MYSSDAGAVEKPAFSVVSKAIGDLDPVLSYRVESQFSDIVKLADYALEIANAISIAVAETLRIDLIENSVIKPFVHFVYLTINDIKVIILQSCFIEKLVSWCHN